MKTKKFLALAILLTGAFSMFLTSCSEDTVTEVEKIYGCTNSTAINYNANANNDDGTCILPDQLENTTRTIYSFKQHGDSIPSASIGEPYIDHTHSNLMWETDYKDYGYSTLTGRFVEFDLVDEMTFNEADPSQIQFKAWAQISTNFTGEAGRDDVLPAKPHGVPKGCMPKDLGVRVDTTSGEIISNSDFAYLETTGPAEFYYANKRGFTTSYRVPAKLKFKEEGITTNNGPLKESDVTVYFNFNGWNLADANSTTGALSKKSGFTGYFKFNKTDHIGTAGSSAGSEITVRFDLVVTIQQ